MFNCSLRAGKFPTASWYQTQTLSLNNVLIESVQSYIYLGVVFESELSMNPHLIKVHECVHRKLFRLRKIRKYLNESASLQVYKQTILPSLDYCGFLAMSGNVNNYTSLKK